MNRNLCPLCRFSMRLWALDWRRGAHKRANLDERVMINTAAGFRDECCHTDRDKYLALVNKLNALPLKSSPLAMALWFEIARIKNCNGGHVPSGRTFNAWRSKFEAPTPSPSKEGNHCTCPVRYDHTIMGHLPDCPPHATCNLEPATV